MRGRLLAWCLVAYPRPSRDRDGEVLRALATDLAEHHGVAREALSLVRGGLAERVRGWSVRRRVASVAVVATLVTAVAVPATASEEQVEDEQVVDCPCAVS